MKHTDEASPVEGDVMRKPKLRHPKLGDWMRGIYASADNPIRDGMYVETIYRTGRLNPGKFYRLTNGNGKFWMYQAEATVFLPHNVQAHRLPERQSGGAAGSAPLTEQEE